jgi:hypothetical protein
MKQRRSLDLALPELEAPEREGEPGQSNAWLASLLALRGSGRLPYRDELEESFGEDFGDVGVTLGVSLLEEVGVAALAQGDEILFASSSPGREVVAHELAHVVQMRGGGGAGLGRPGGAAEREADVLGAAAARGEPVAVQRRTDGAVHCMISDPAAFAATWETEFYSPHRPIAEQDLAFPDRYEADQQDIVAIHDHLGVLNPQTDYIETHWEDDQTAYDPTLGEHAQQALRALRQLLERGEAIQKRDGMYVAPAKRPSKRQLAFYEALNRVLKAAGDWSEAWKDKLESYARWAKWNEQGHTQDASVTTATQRVGDLKEKSGDKWAYHAYATSQLPAPGPVPPDVQDRILRVIRRTCGQPIQTWDEDGWRYVGQPGEEPPKKQVHWRLYLNVHPSFVGAVASRLVPLLGVEGAQGQTHALKFGGQAELQARPDRIVLYVRSDGGGTAERDRLGDKIVALQAEGLPDELVRLTAQRGLAATTWGHLFLDEIPLMTEPIGDSTGLARAPQPPQPDTDPRGISYGEHRMKPLQRAWEKERGRNFETWAIRELLDADIHPARPWEPWKPKPPAVPPRVRPPPLKWEPAPGPSGAGEKEPKRLGFLRRKGGK